MKRKTVFLVSLFLANVFISCNNKELNERTNVPEIGTGTKVISESELIQGIETINNKYVNRSPKIRKLDNMDLETTVSNIPLSLIDEYTTTTVNADLQGAAVGASIGSAFNLGLGTLCGAIIGGAGASIAMAHAEDNSALTSTLTSDNTSSGSELFPTMISKNAIWGLRGQIDYIKPYYYSALDVDYLGETLCSQVGKYHNIIAQAFEEDFPNYNLTNSELASYIDNHLSNLINEPEVSDMSSLILESMIAIYDNVNDLASLTNSCLTETERTIINSCYENFKRITQSQRLPYVHSICAYVSDVTIDTPLERTGAIINSALSTLYYSSIFWRTIIPEAVTPPTIAINVDNPTEWFRINSASVEDILCSGNYCFGVPVFYGDTLDRIFFFQTTLYGSNQYALDVWNGNETFEISESVECLDWSTGSFVFSIQNGNYPITLNPDGSAACIFLSSSALNAE